MNAREILRDASGRLLGSIERRNNRYALYDVNNRFLGEWDPISDRTYDSHNGLLGEGNLLAALLHKTL